ncbi:helix-turn-helix transcriptional regulator [Streptomyces sp. Isolate_219]|uniref:helix-turn-helix transcriptional regulator n=1 Tax=Streptomyces sp. Isolate_219 TaxID=2950110 RepID=UPI0021CA87FE|nr:helix-turn-helix transcriptional regulator [Streptomyces sp. Isolate_219]MCR8574739.1 helix-turn-helix domain-containing protein [Streptomyces sp. Isolate_219]
MERDWTRLGAALKVAREACSYTQAAVAEMIGVKRGTMRNIENGDIARVTPTVRAYARAVGWDEGSVDAVLAGGMPTEAPAARSPEARDVAAAESIAVAAPEELPLRVQAALREGPLIDTAVINLPGDDDGPEGQMVVIVKGRNGATPEQLKRALLRWEEAETKLRRTEGDSATDQD